MKGEIEKRLALTVDLEVHKAAMEMAKKRGVSLASMGNEIMLSYGKSQYESACESLQFLENVEGTEEMEEVGEEMKKSIRKDQAAVKALALLYFGMIEEVKEAMVEDGGQNVSKAKSGGKK